MELVDFYVNRITPPEDVQRMMDERAGMQAVGDLDKFFKYKAAKAMGDAAAGNGSMGGGEAAAGMGLGVGAGMGMLIPGMLLRSIKGEAVTPQAVLETGTTNCPECHGAVTIDSRFCAHCGHQMVVIRKCPQCDKHLTATAKFCSSCGLNLAAELRCGSCQTKLPPGTKFCFNCGEPAS
jgi:membrane protease subunit (stomatin/prohibitin family)